MVMPALPRDWVTVRRPMKFTPEDLGECPCGEQAIAGQIWVTEWFNRVGLIDKCYVVRLCVAHRARRPGED